MAPSSLFCPNPALLLPWPCRKKTLNLLTILIFFFIIILIFWFSQGYPRLFQVGSRADCPQWLNVCGANLWRCWVSRSRGGAAHPAIPGICNFPALPTCFFIPSTAHQVLTPSSFTISFSSLPVFLLQVSQLENNRCKVGFF